MGRGTNIKIRIMKIITIIEGDYYSSYIEEYDIYFPTLIEKGRKEIIKRAVMIVESYKKYVK